METISYRYPSEVDADPEVLQRQQRHVEASLGQKLLAALAAGVTYTVRVTRSMNVDTTFFPHPVHEIKVWYERVTDVTAGSRRHRTVVCLCGSTRFSKAFQQANLTETLVGNIVLSIGCDLRSDEELFAGKSEDELCALKQELDALHLDKIDLADEVLILNVGGYVGPSTLRELIYAREHGKRIRWLEPDKALGVPDND